MHDGGSPAAAREEWAFLRLEQGHAPLNVWLRYETAPAESSLTVEAQRTRAVRRVVDEPRHLRTLLAVVGVPIESSLGPWVVKESGLWPSGVRDKAKPFDAE